MPYNHIHRAQLELDDVDEHGIKEKINHGTDDRKMYAIRWVRVTSVGTAT